MKHVHTYESFLNESVGSYTGAELIKDVNKFEEIVAKVFADAQAKEEHVKLKDVKEWLKQDIVDNKTFDYGKDMDFTVSSFFEWFDN